MLVCAECGTVADEAANGWLLHTTNDPSGPESPQLAVCCPDHGVQPSR